MRSHWKRLPAAITLILQGLCLMLPSHVISTICARCNVMFELLRVTYEMKLPTTNGCPSASSGCFITILSLSFNKLMVGDNGIEPIRPLGHKILSHACLPSFTNPPYLQLIKALILKAAYAPFLVLCQGIEP